jgi:hypothetical protein
MPPQSVSHLEVGLAVRVRNRLATIRAVEPYDSRDAQGRLHIVDVEYLNLGSRTGVIVYGEQGEEFPPGIFPEGGNDVGTVSSRSGMDSGPRPVIRREPGRSFPKRSRHVG